MSEFVKLLGCCTLIIFLVASMLICAALPAAAYMWSWDWEVPKESSGDMAALVIIGNFTGLIPIGILLAIFGGEEGVENE